MSVQDGLHHREGGYAHGNLMPAREQRPEDDVAHPQKQMHCERAASPSVMAANDEQNRENRGKAVRFDVTDAVQIARATVGCSTAAPGPRR